MCNHKELGDFPTYNVITRARACREMETSLCWANEVTYGADKGQDSIFEMSNISVLSSLTVLKGRL